MYAYFIIALHWTNYTVIFVRSARNRNVFGVTNKHRHKNNHRILSVDD